MGFNKAVAGIRLGQAPGLVAESLWCFYMAEDSPRLTGKSRLVEAWYTDSTAAPKATAFEGPIDAAVVPYGKKIVYTKPTDSVEVAAEQAATHDEAPALDTKKSWTPLKTAAVAGGVAAAAGLGALAWHHHKKRQQQAAEAAAQFRQYQLNTLPVSDHTFNN